MVRPKTNIEDTGIDAVVTIEVTLPGKKYGKHTFKIKNIKGSIVESRMSPATVMGPVFGALRQFGKLE